MGEQGVKAWGRRRGGLLLDAGAARPSQRPAWSIPAIALGLLVLALVAGVVAIAVPRSAERLPGTAPADYYNFGQGLIMIGANGGVFAFGNAPFKGSEAGQHLNAPIVGSARTADGQGYWLVGSDGGIYAFGDAAFEGSEGGQHLNAPIVGMAATGDSGGYWLVGSDGGVYAFGDAPFYGSLPASGITPNGAISGIAVTRDGGGYWLVSTGGSVYAFGDAPNFGSMAGQPLSAPIFGIAPVPSGQGYWLVGSDGGVYAFGDAQFYSTPVPTHLPLPIVGLNPTTDGAGYWLVGSDGGMVTYGDAHYIGGESNNTVTEIVGIASNPSRYWPPIPGGDSPAGSPALVSNGDGRLEAFTRTTNCTMYHTWQSTAGSASPFGGFWPIGACLASSPVVVRDVTGALEEFAMTSSGAVFHEWQTSPGGAWTAWQGTSMVAVPGTQLAAVVQPAGAVDVYFRAANGCLWHAWQSTAGQPTTLGGSYQVGNACNVASDPAVVVQQNGQTVVLFDATNGQVWETSDAGANQQNSWHTTSGTPLSNIESGTDLAAVN